MAAKQWINDDLGYENWLSAHQNGFMANMSKRPHSKYFTALHIIYLTDPTRIRSIRERATVIRR
jgi:hypothetical protein